MANEESKKIRGAPRMRHVVYARSAVTRCAGMLALCALIGQLGGCIGLAITQTEYTEVTTPPITRSEATSLFGSPVRLERDGSRESWFYLFIGRGLSRSAVRSTFSAGAVIVVPFWWSTEYDDNVRFDFEGDLLVHAYERTQITSGGVCGLVLSHGIQPICDAGADQSSSTKLESRDLRNPPTIRAQPRKHVEECKPPAVSAEEAACLAQKFLISQGIVAPVAFYEIQDFGTNFIVFYPATEGSPRRRLRVDKLAGLVRMVDLQ